MKKSSLKFTEEGKAVQIVFPDGSESTAFYSQEEAFEAIDDCTQKDKVSAEDAITMKQELLEAKSLRATKSERKIEVVVLGGKGILGLLLMAGLLDALTTDSATEDAEPVTRPTFRMCDCGVKESHGRIYTKEGHTSPLFSREHALSVTEELTGKAFTAEEATLVKEDIEAAFADASVTA